MIINSLGTSHYVLYHYRDYQSIGVSDPVIPISEKLRYRDREVGNPCRVAKTH
jgi:hypothetical protein